jgi:hypothetical protein
MANTEGHFDYEIEVRDKFSGPLDRLVASLKSAEEGFERLQAAGKTSAANLQNVAQAAKAAKQSRAAGNDELSQLKDLEKIQENIRKANKRSFDEQTRQNKADAKGRKDYEKLLESNERKAEKARKAQDKALKAEAKALKDYQKLLDDNDKKAEQGRKARDRALKAEAKALKDYQKLLDDNDKKAEKARRAADRRLQAEARGLKDFQRLLDENDKKEAARLRATPEGRARSIIAEAAQRQKVTDILAKQGFDPRGLKQLSGFEKALEGIKKTALSAASSVGSLVVAFLAFRVLQSIGDVLGAAGRSVVDFNSKVEDATIGIASLLTAVGEVRDVTGQAVPPAAALAIAQVEAQKQVKELRKEALLTAATFEELSAAFQTAIAPGLNAGLDIDQVRQFSIQIAQAASALGVAGNQLSEEIRSILQGTITARTTRIATALGITNEDINRAKEQGKLADLLQTKFQAFNVAAQEAAKTFTVILSNLKDGFDQVVGESSIALFEDVKGILKEINGFLIKRDKDGLVTVNPQVVEAIQSITDGIRFAIKQVRELDVSFEDVKAAAEVIGVSIRLFGFLVRQVGGSLRTIYDAFFKPAIDSVRIMVAAFEKISKIWKGLQASGSPGQSFGASALKGGPSGIIADMGEQAAKTKVAIEDLQKQISRLSIDSGGGSGSLFSAQSASITEYQDLLQAVRREEAEARKVLVGFMRRAAEERGTEVKTLGLIRFQAEKLTKSLKDQAEVERELANLARQRQVAEVRSQILKAPEDITKQRAELLKAQGFEVLAAELLRKERTKAAEQEVSLLQILRAKTRSLEEQAAISVRIAQIQAANVLQTKIEDTATTRTREEEAAKATISLLDQRADAVADLIALTRQQQQEDLERERQIGDTIRSTTETIRERDRLLVQGLEDADRGQFGEEKGFGEAALRLRVRLLREETEEKKRNLDFEAAALGISKETEVTRKLQKQVLDEILDLNIRNLEVERQRSLATRPERFGGTQTVGQEFLGGLPGVQTDPEGALSVDVLGQLIGTGQQMVSAFGDFISSTIFNAFDPDADILANFGDFLGQLAQMIISTLVQIAVVQAALKIGSVLGGGFATPDNVVGGAASMFSGVAGAFAGGGQVGYGYAASPAHAHARGYAFGGRPAGLPASDTVPAWLTPGEWVMRLAAVRKYGAETMARINAGLVDPMGLRALASEASRASTEIPAGLGRAGGGPAPASLPTAPGAPVQAFVVANERAAADLNAGGHGAQIRWMRQNKATIKSALGI